MRNSTRSVANAVLRKYALVAPSLDDLVSVVSDEGFEIVDFDPESEAMLVLRERLHFTDSIMAQNAFVYQNDNVRLLFVRDTLTGQEKLYAIAHELGHIVLGHANPKPSVIEEHEANEFSHYILNPQVSSKLRSIVLRHKRITAGVVIAVMLVALAVGYYIGTSHRGHYTDGFYVTPSGTKYHRAACSVIQGRTNARKMTIEEYESGAYEPCSLCVPED